MLADEWMLHSPSLSSFGTSQLLQWKVLCDHSFNSAPSFSFSLPSVVLSATPNYNRIVLFHHTGIASFMNATSYSKAFLQPHSLQSCPHCVLPPYVYRDVTGALPSGQPFLTLFCCPLYILPLYFYKDVTGALPSGQPFHTLFYYPLRLTLTATLSSTHVPLPSHCIKYCCVFILKIYLTGKLLQGGGEITQRCSNVWIKSRF